MAGAFPELVIEVQQLEGDLVMDGELVVQDQEGKERFEWVVGRAARSPVTAKKAAVTRPALIFVFDLLAQSRNDFRRKRLSERKSILESVLARNDRVRFAGHIESKGLELYGLAEVQGLEGIVGKRADSLYSAGRTQDWLKVKTPAGKDREASRMEHLRR
jgi:bifunctional non-homologous end joining protein LigD